MHRRVAGIWLVAVILTGLLPPALVSAADEPPTVDGLVSIDQSPFTPSPNVTLRLAPPSTTVSRVRISNDDVSWLELDWAALIPWSLIDPAAGGTDTDGHKFVVVEYGDGTTWTQRGTAQTTLDRQAPTIGDVSFWIDGRTWSGGATVTPFDGISAGRYSLDGTTWTPWQEPLAVDLFNVTGIGSWVASQERTLYAQFRDEAGNVSTTSSGPTDLRLPAHTDDGEGPLDVRFEYPSFPIEGKPFTIKPIYPSGYTLPADTYCEWVLHWGDDESIFGVKNEAYGELIVERHKSKGVCGAWTFTIPHTNGRQFHWMMQIGRKDADQMWGYWKEALFSDDSLQHHFKAAEGTTDRRFLTSTFPFAYLLPETTVSQKGDPVTYRLHTVGTTTVPQTGMFWTQPLDCYINPAWSQTGGTTYTYTPICDGNWVTGWTGTMLGGYMRSQYDPIVDGRAPKVVAPTVRLRASTFGTTAPISISWSATDAHTSVFAHELQMSRDGGAWTSVALPNRLTKSVVKWLALTGTYRFRVRARDYVGNWSAWVAGPTVTARSLEQSSASIAWSSGWSTVSSSAFSGGSARASTTAGATATLRFSGRSVAWVTRSGPGRGLAQVWIDGALATTIDLNAGSLGPRRVAFSKTWSVSGTHTIVIKVLGTSGRPLVETDAFLLLR